MTENLKLLIKWGTIALAVFALFYFWIPVNIYRQGPVFFALVGCISFTVAFMKAVFYAYKYNIEVESKDQTEEEIALASAERAKDKDAGCMIMILLMVALFLSGFLFIIRETQMEEDELKVYGVVTTAGVCSGRLLASRRADFSSITVGFTLPSGDSSWATISISKSEFDGHYKGERVFVVYSSRYPALAKVYTDIGELNKFEIMTKRKLTIPPVNER